MCKSFFKSLFTSALNPCYFMSAYSLKYSSQLIIPIYHTRLLAKLLCMNCKQPNRTSASRGAGVAAKGNPRTTHSALAVVPGVLQAPSGFFQQFRLDGSKWSPASVSIFLLVWDGKKTKKNQTREKKKKTQLLSFAVVQIIWHILCYENLSKGEI